MLPSALHEGYRRFRSDRFATEKARYRELAGGQDPDTMIIGCADSRVDPSTIFAAAPGELFVSRNVAALVPPYEADAGYHGTSAAVEFAVTILNVRNIVVMGHGLCGGVAASLASVKQRRAPGQFIGPWVDLISGERDRMLSENPDASADRRQRLMEWTTVLYSIRNLRTFPFIVEAEKSGLTLHGAWFSIAEGMLYWYDRDAGVFSAVDF